MPENEKELGRGIADAPEKEERTPAKPGRLRSAAAELRKLRSICGAGMLTALNVVLDQFSVMLTPTLRIGLGFLPASVCGWAYGPVMAGLLCAVSDVLTFVIKPRGAFNPVWTLVAFVPGLIYGLVLYRKPVSLWRTALAKALETVLVRWGLNPLCMMLLLGEGGYWFYLSTRLVKNLLLLPLEVAAMYVVLKAMQRVLPKR
ncbi:MAG: folate family ECF transporter S component [Oscillospiraceae bacterium]|nr:folate family ECF transporter S component [Oscillospiraceae bacterium]